MIKLMIDRWQKELKINAEGTESRIDDVVVLVLNAVIDALQEALKDE